MTMPRIRRSWLPEGVTEYRDRHGKQRFRFRKAGRPTYHFKSAPGTEDFRIEYAACSTAEPVAPAPVTRAKPGSLADLYARFRATPRWRGWAPATQSTYGRVLDKIAATHGHRLVRDATTADLDRIIGRMHATPTQANKLRKALGFLFGYAVKIGWRADNPVTATDRFKVSGGYHTWTEAEIAQYRAHHAYGTTARLAMELALNTAGRRCNLATLERAQLRDGRFQIEHAKGGKATSVPAAAATIAAIEAMPAIGIKHFIVTAYGKPFTIAGFGNKFRQWANEAGLPHCSLHGLRKAQSRRLAESGATVPQGKAVTGQGKDETFLYYAEQANRSDLADAAMANLEARFANPTK
jgi:integrase